MEGGSRSRRKEEMKECGTPSPPPALYKGARWGLGRPAQRIKAREEQGVGANPLPLLTTAQFRTPPSVTPSAWEPRGGEAELRRQVRRHRSAP